MNEIGKYTTGPWIVDGLQVWSVDGCHFVANVPYTHINDREKAIANRQLIASAPDLLLALETIEAATDGLSNGLAMEINHAAKAAIAKATKVTP